MKLYVSLTSPFARKVRVAVAEKGITRQCQQIVVDPWHDDGTLAAVNPLLQVPTAVMDDGLAMTNSDTINNWLERSFPEPPLWPRDPAGRDRAEATAALAQTLIEYAVFLVLERRRPGDRRDADMIERRRDGIVRTAGILEQRFHAATGHFNLDSIGVACALSYLDFRHPDLDWRGHAPGLDTWLAWAQERASMRSTAPPPG